jgi:hypothetical protein
MASGVVSRPKKCTRTAAYLSSKWFDTNGSTAPSLMARSAHVREFTSDSNSGQRPSACMRLARLRIRPYTRGRRFWRRVENIAEPRDRNPRLLKNPATSGPIAERVERRARLACCSWYALRLRFVFGTCDSLFRLEGYQTPHSASPRLHFLGGIHLQEIPLNVCNRSRGLGG